MAKRAKKETSKAAPASEPTAKYSSLLEQIGAPRNKYTVVGTWALIIAVLLSVMLALIDTPYLVIILIAVGFLVGFLNFEHEETVKFLVATISMLVIASALLLTGFSRLELVVPVFAMFLERAAYNVIAVSAPAAFVISLKALRELAE